MSGIKGDMNALAKMRQALANAKSVPDRTAMYAAPALTEQMQADFAARRAPDGSGWGGNYTLVREGRLRDALRFGQAGKRLRVSDLPPYARYQNPRRFIPVGGSKLPGSYRVLVDAVSARAFRELTGSAR